MIFKAKLFKIISSYLFVIIILVLISIWRMGISSSVTWLTCCFALIFSFCRALFSRFLLSIAFNKGEVRLIYYGNLFRKNELIARSNDIFFSYKPEIIGLGSTMHILTFYDHKRDQVIKIRPSSNGFTQTQVEEIVAECRKSNIEQINADVK
jgi:hypothetical protein